MGTKRTFGIFFVRFVAWMRWAVMPRRGERRTGVAASSVGTGHRGIAGVIGGTVPGTLFCVRLLWTRFVVFSARFVVGFGAFIMAGASDIRRRSCIALISGVVPTLCSALGATLCWSCVGVPTWGTSWISSSGRIHAWHGLERKAGPSGCTFVSANFA